MLGVHHPFVPAYQRIQPEMNEHPEPCVLPPFHPTPAVENFFRRLLLSHLPFSLSLWFIDLRRCEKTAGRFRHLDARPHRMRYALRS
jgi:hypothetical protein